MVSTAQTLRTFLHSSKVLASSTEPLVAFSLFDVSKVDFVRLTHGSVPLMRCSEARFDRRLDSLKHGSENFRPTLTRRLASKFDWCLNYSDHLTFSQQTALHVVYYSRKDTASKLYKSDSPWKALTSKKMQRHSIPENVGNEIYFGSILSSSKLSTGITALVCLATAAASNDSPKSKRFFKFRELFPSANHSSPWNCFQLVNNYLKKVCERMQDEHLDNEWTWTNSTKRKCEKILIIFYLKDVTLQAKAKKSTVITRS